MTVSEEPNKGKKLWKIELVIGIVLPFLIIGSALFVLVLALPVDGKGFIDLPDGFLIVSIWGMVLVVLGIILIRTILQYRTLYKEPTYYMSGRPLQKKTSLCVLCGKHPTSKRYHINKVHNLEDAFVRENFKACGCDLCLVPPEWGPGPD